MLRINGKVFMNLQEAVQWLLDNNVLPYQCTANYVADTEIGIGTIVNPSPAKVRIGSLILFADCKVATVTGITDSGFIVGSQYIDYAGDVVAKLLGQDINVHDITAHEIQTQLFRTSMATIDDIIEFDKMETMTNDSWARIFEAIVDDNLHKRFVEGSITTPTISGVTISYAKWSLSGTHLLIVIAGSIESGTTLTNSTLGQIMLPDWIKDKIVPIVNNLVEEKNSVGWGTDYTQQSINVDLLKYSSLDIVASITTTAKRYFRIQFDLLIDND